MHQVVFLLQILLFFIFALRIGEVLIKYLLRVRVEMDFISQGILKKEEVIKSQPFFRPFSAFCRIMKSASTPSGKGKMLILELLMELVCVVLFPLQVLGAPQTLQRWIMASTYLELQIQSDRIEFPVLDEGKKVSR